MFNKNGETVLYQVGLLDYRAGLHDRHMRPSACAISQCDTELQYPPYTRTLTLFQTLIEIDFQLQLLTPVLVEKDGTGLLSLPTDAPPPPKRNVFPIHGAGRHSMSVADEERNAPPL
ncbi:hypothetical protein J6590_017742 [Homalodisca vitripennis]|nr:hypothetical protein J6590_017742 [Homalodisca vitripennis]